MIEIATRKVLTDDLKWIKFTGFGWAGNGFFYSRFDAPEPGHELSSKNEFQKVYYHVLGTEQSADELIYEDKQNAQRFQSVATTNDERFAILTVSDRGKGTRQRAVFPDLSKKKRRLRAIVTGNYR